MTDLPREISDETVNAFLRAAHDAGAGAYISGGEGRLEVNDDHVRAGLAAALVASDWRPEAEVLREAADRIDPGPASTRRPAVNDLDDMQMTCDRGVAARLRLWADIRERYGATALEPVGALPVADGSEVCGKPTLRGMPCVLPADHSEPNIHHAEGQERSGEQR